MEDIRILKNKDGVDFEILRRHFENEVIEYGIIKGNNTVFFTKAGANGSMRGYEDKYLTMGINLHKKYGYTVVCSSNPFAIEESIGQGMEVIEQYIKEPYQVYYFGHSNGAVMGARNAWKYPQIKRFVLVNGPLMTNWHKTREGTAKFKGERMVYVYGEEDPSFKFAGLVNLVGNPAVSLITVPKADHNFYGMLDEFEQLPEKYC
jgi:hypothetical protein